MLDGRTDGLTEATHLLGSIKVPVYINVKSVRAKKPQLSQTFLLLTPY